MNRVADVRVARFLATSPNQRAAVKGIEEGLHWHPLRLAAESTLTSVATAPGGGFWVQVDGTSGNYSSGTFAKDGAPAFENFPDRD